MTDLTPKMTIQVTTVYATLPAGPADADGWVPYTGPGTWRMYGFTGEKPPSVKGGVWIDCCVCNECAADDANVEPVRQKIIRNLSIVTAGRLIPVLEPRMGCQACGRRVEGERRER